MNRFPLNLSRRNFLSGLGAFTFSTSFGAIDLAPKSAFTGKLTGRTLKMASVGCGGTVSPQAQRRSADRRSSTKIM